MGQGSDAGERSMQVDASQAQHGAAAAAADGTGEGAVGTDDDGTEDIDAEIQAFVNRNGGKRKAATALGRRKTSRKRVRK
jgi:hypothetical protein